MPSYCLARAPDPDDAGDRRGGEERQRDIGAVLISPHAPPSLPIETPERRW